MSIGNVDINFDQLTGFNTIIGENYMVQDNAKSNGSGKSSIFEALIWCLTGETIRGNKDIVNHNTEGGAAVSVTFDCDGHSYVIERYKNHHKFKTNLLIKINGEDKSGKGIRDTEKLLESYLPELTASLIGSVIVLGQGLPSRFTNNTPSARKEVLEKLTQSDFMIEDIRTHVMERRYDLSVSLRECQDEMLSCKTLKSACEAAFKDAQEKYSSLDDINSKRNRLQEIQEELAALRQNTLRYSNEYTELDEQVASLQSEYNSLESSQNNELLILKNEYSEKSGLLQADIAALNATIKALDNSIANAKKVTDTCPTCHQKLPGVYIPNTSEDETELARLKEVVADIANQQQQLYEEYNIFKWNEVESRYKNRLHEIKNCLFKLIAKRTEASSLKEKAECAIKTCEYQLVKLNSEIELHEVNKNNLLEEMRKQENKLAELDLQYKKLEEEEISINQHIAVVTKFETIIKRDFRGYQFSFTGRKNVGNYGGYRFRKVFPY